jgi:hypothetical protein
MNCRTTIASLLLTAVTASLSFGQGMPDHVKKSLDKLVGTWKMETPIDGEVTEAALTVEWAVDDTAIRFAWKGTDVLTRKLGSSTGILGWHPTKKLCIENEVGTDGFTSDGSHWISEDGTWESPIRGTNNKPDGTIIYFEEHRTFKFVSADEFNITIEGVVDGERMKPRVTTFRRKK